MDYFEFEETILKNIFQHKEDVKQNKVYKILQEKIVEQVKKLDRGEVGNDDLKKILHLMEVKSEILLIKIYLDAISDFEDLENIIGKKEIKSHLQNFSLIEIYNEIYVDDHKNGVVND